LSDPLAKPAPVWQPVPAREAEAEAFAWLKARKADADATAKAEAIWRDLPSQASEDDLLVRVARTFALIDANAAKLLAMCSQSRAHLVVPGEPWLRGSDVPPFFANNLRLLFAGWLAHESLFDEAKEQLDGLNPDDVVAPASLLFYQSVVYHALLNKESGLKSIDELLQGADLSPRRYVELARLMEEDLQGLEDDTLDHVARRMDDIRRRLDLGRAGPVVRKEEDGVIASLDKMIKKLEEQQRQQDQSSGNLHPTRPAEESRIMRGKGPGEAGNRRVGSESGWGNLPPKQREQAMQQIGRDFPSQYREAVEEYFRRLAAEEGGESGK